MRLRVRVDPSLLSSETTGGRTQQGILISVPSGLSLVRDLCCHLSNRLGIPSDHVVASVDGFALPAEQPLSGILKEGDLLLLRSAQDRSLDSGGFAAGSGGVARAWSQVVSEQEALEPLAAPLVSLGMERRVEATRQERSAAFLREWAPSDLTASSADYYFNPFNHYGVHEEILGDAATISAYRAAIERSAPALRGKVVLDVCAGLGFFSLLALKAGARRVVALEPQPELVSMASKVARRNGFGSDVLEFVCAKPQDVGQLPGGLEQVDAIVSQWFGYFLMRESRIAELLYARDRWLAPGGLMLPDRARLLLAALEDKALVERRLRYDDVWGFNFRAMEEPVRREPLVWDFGPGAVLSNPSCALDLDLYSCSASDCFGMASRFSLRCKRRGSLHGLLCWFEVHFCSRDAPAVMLNTSPSADPTCWKQTALYLAGPRPRVDAGELVRGMLAVRRLREGQRGLDVKVTCETESTNDPSTHYFRWT